MRRSERYERGQFAALIRDARRKRGWTQEYLADISGVSRSTLIRWESGEITDPDIALLFAVVDALRIDLDVAYRALGWLHREPDSTADDQPPRTWVAAIRAIIGLTDLPAERRLERILELLDEYDAGRDAGRDRERAGSRG